MWLKLERLAKVRAFYGNEVIQKEALCFPKSPDDVLMRSNKLHFSQIGDNNAYAYDYLGMRIDQILFSRNVTSSSATRRATNFEELINSRSTNQLQGKPRLYEHPRFLKEPVSNFVN